MDKAIKEEMIALLPKLRGFAYSLTGNAGDIDDLVQETCERAIKNLDKWTPGTRLDSWMYRIAQNIHYNRVRGDNRRARHLRVVVDESDQALDGERAVMASIDLSNAQALIGQLPEDQRTVLYLVAVGGHGYREVADMLDLPIGTITSRLARARQALKQDMEGTGP